MFTKARHNRVFEDVIQQVEEAILKGELKPGDRLPSERDLQKVLDVGRGTLRESLRVLEQKGLIEIKPGAKGGIFIKGLGSGQMSDSLDLYVRSHHVSIDNLTEYREDVECLIAARAAEKASSEEVEELRRLVEKMENQLFADPPLWDEFIETDKEIHLYLAGIAGNPLHRVFLDIVHDKVHRYNVKLNLPKEQLTRKFEIEDMTDLVDAVAAGDRRRASDVARRHVIRFNEFIKSAKKSR